MVVGLVVALCTVVGADAIRVRVTNHANYPAPSPEVDMPCGEKTLSGESVDHGTGEGCQARDKCFCEVDGGCDTVCAVFVDRCGPTGGTGNHKGEPAAYGTPSTAIGTTGMLCTCELMSRPNGGWVLVGLIVGGIAVYAGGGALYNHRVKGSELGVGALPHPEFCEYTCTQDTCVLTSSGTILNLVQTCLIHALYPGWAPER